MNVATDVCLLDFQAVRPGPPAQDLVNFWYTSANADLFPKAESFLKVYYDEFFACLEALHGSLTKEQYPFERCVEEFRKSEIYGFIMCFCALPVLMISKEDFPKDYGTQGMGEGFNSLAAIALGSPDVGDRCVKRFLPYIERAKNLGII